MSRNLRDDKTSSVVRHYAERDVSKTRNTIVSDYTPQAIPHVVCQNQTAPATKCAVKLLLNHCTEPQYRFSISKPCQALVGKLEPQLRRQINPSSSDFEGFFFYCRQSQSTNCWLPHLQRLCLHYGPGHEENG